MLLRTRRLLGDDAAQAAAAALGVGIQPRLGGEHSGGSGELTAADSASRVAGSNACNLNGRDLEPHQNGRLL